MPCISWAIVLCMHFLAVQKNIFNSQSLSKDFVFPYAYCSLLDPQVKFHIFSLCPAVPSVSFVNLPIKISANNIDYVRDIVLCAVTLRKEACVLMDGQALVKT